MTLSTTTTRVQYDGNGSTTAFSVPYKFLSDSDLVVVLTSSAGVDTTQTITTHYTVTNSGNGGTVTMVTAPASGETLTISRVVSLTQETDYIEGDDFPAETHEAALDKLTMIAQQHDDTLGRAITVPRTVATTFDGELTPTASKIIGFNSSATAFQLFTPSEAGIDDASAVTYTAGYTDGVQRTVQAALDDVWIPVTNFDGVVADGSTDVYSEIQAAIDSISSDGGGVLYFPPTSTYYRITRALRVPSNMMLTGAGYASRIHLDWAANPGLQYAAAIHIEGEYTDLTDNKTNPTFWGYADVDDTIFIDLASPGASKGDLTVDCAVAGAFSSITDGEWVAFLEGPGPNYYSNRRFFAKANGAPVGDTLTLDRPFEQDFTGSTIDTALPTADADSDRLACYRITMVENVTISNLRITVNDTVNQAVVPIRLAHAANVFLHDLWLSRTGSSETYNIFNRFCTKVYARDIVIEEQCIGTLNSSTHCVYENVRAVNAGGASNEWGEGGYDNHWVNCHCLNCDDTNPNLGIAGHTYNSSVIGGSYSQTSDQSCITVSSFAENITIRDARIAINYSSGVGSQAPIKLVGGNIYEPVKRVRIIDNHLVAESSSYAAVKTHPYPYIEEVLITGNVFDADIGVDYFGGSNVDKRTHRVHNNFYRDGLSHSDYEDGNLTLGGLNVRFWFSGEPSVSSFDANDLVVPKDPTANTPWAYLCTTGGTFGTLNGGSTTGGITTGTTALTVSSATGMQKGAYITIAGVSGVKKVVSGSGTSWVIDSNADATVAGAAVAYSAPVLKALPTSADALADLNQTISGTYTQSEVQAISDKVDALLALMRSAGLLDAT